MMNQTVTAQYNQLLSAGVDEGRLNRALELVKQGGASKYQTTTTGCNCADFVHRQSKVAGGRCKHMLALALTTKPRPELVITLDALR